MTGLAIHVLFSDGKAINAELALIQQYQLAFARIKEVTGEDDVNFIVENFRKDETENFALFNYVNELNSEIETLNDQVKKNQICSPVFCCFPKKVHCRPITGDAISRQHVHMKHFTGCGYQG